MVWNCRRILSTVLVLLFAVVAAAQRQTGKATFYSKRATGARTSSGELLHHDSLTCAHRTYPFGTKLRVVNPANGKEVIVRVTDRGPFARGRIIDLSWSAARDLDILSKGVAAVIVEVVELANAPYRPSERIELPELDFDVSDAGYSFIDAWNSETKRKQEAALQKAVKEPLSANKPKTASKESAAAAAKSAQVKPENNVPKPNKWSDAFKKTKNMHETSTPQTHKKQ